MISFPNAKINLGLNIVSKRSDGYHNIETIFYPIGLKDALEIIPSESGKDYRLFLSGIRIDGEEDENLIIKALKLIAREKPIPCIDIHLLKKIPFGAGLGGGSSDAAFMLKLLNETFSLNYSDEELEEKAAQIGADCAFFIRNKPAFASEIGNVLESVAINLSAYQLVLVKPDCRISTKEAYAMVNPHKAEVSLKEIILKPVSEWKKFMKNDFEESVFTQFPKIRTIKQQLYEHGAVYASMSGSGSSVYGLFHHIPELGDAFKNHFVWTTYQ